ncbi:MAG: glycosyltransferase [Gammaproteobacteria bacterium]|nr:glycosyltransferase [Gammaproteobacteria bacterium]
MSTQPKLAVFSTLFPNAGQPNAGVFVRERMFRVGKKIPVIVIAPIPWFPFQGLIRHWRPHFRPSAPAFEYQDGYEVFHPRFFSIPGLLKSFDGFFMAMGCRKLIRHLRSKDKFNIIDAHFGYPDGYAATLLGKWFSVPVCITMRGTEVPHAKSFLKRRHLIKAMERASQLFSVSSSLKEHAVNLGIDESKIQVVGNGVDVERFYPVSKEVARQQVRIPQEAKVLITIGGLVERKGFHRVIEVMPSLMEKHPNLHYLIVGGASAEGDWSEKLKSMVVDAGLQSRVHFLGTMSPDKINIPLSAADVFVLSTRNEGWANVILEAMACGLPVVASDVGGNAEVVANKHIGTIVPFGDRDTLCDELGLALSRKWDHEAIIDYAKANSWNKRVDLLVSVFNTVLKEKAD